jgi:hypothetical protein
VDRHLWIVLSDPDANPETVLLVSVTTWRPDKDPACKIQRGEHLFVTHESCVHYLDARDASLAQLRELKNTGALKIQDPLTPDLLRRVLDGAGASKFLKLKYQELLVDQGLIDPPLTT